MILKDALDKAEKRRAAARRRKAKSRARLKAAQLVQEQRHGAVVIEIKLTLADRERLDNMCMLRAVTGDPYQREEYIAELILNDERRYQEQVAALGCCGKCKSPLPSGCDDLFKGDSDCYRSRQYRELQL